MRQHIKLKLWGQGIKKRVEIPEKFRVSLGGFPSSDIETDETGFITGPIPPRSEMPIYFLGDSFVECSFLQFGSRLTDRFNELLREHGKVHYAYNAGMSGSSILNLYNLYLNLLACKKDSITLLFLGAITYTQSFFCRSFWNRDSNSPLTDTHEKEQRRTHPDEFNDVKRLLSLFKHTSDVFANRVILCIVPYNSHFQNNTISKMNSSLRLFCKELDLPFIDLEIIRSNTSDLFYDAVHLNSLGAKFYSNVIYDSLSKNGSV